MLIAVVATALVAGAATLALALCLQVARRRQRRYEALLEGLPQTSILLFDRQERIRVAAGSGLDGRAAASLRGRKIAEAFPGEAGAELARHCRAALAGERRSIELRSADGRDQWLRVQPVGDGSGPTGGLAISQDITDRKRIERAREAAESARRFVIDEMNDAYVACDDAGLVTDWNERATRMFGYTRSEALGRRVPELIIPARDHADFDRLLASYTHGRRREEQLDLRVERQARDKEGRTFPVELAAATLSIDGQVSLHSFMHDITVRKQREEERDAREVEADALVEATADLARTTEPRQARRAICAAALRLAAADFVLLFEPDDLGRGLVVRESEGADLVGTVVPFVGQHSGAVRCYTTQEQVFVADMATDPLVVHSLAREVGARSGIWVPIRGTEQTLGVLAVAWSSPREELPERVATMLASLADDTAVAIERAGRLAQLDLMARTDDLTGLPNRRAWDEGLARELLRARRGGTSLAVAMVDLDNFKRYNDRHGHLAGDELLRTAASTWRRALREMDMLARYGGEEFSIVLPSCHSVAARALVDRLRGLTPSGQSCSAGVSVWDGDEGAERLVGRADGALYVAKQSGRDRTVIA